jgi:gp16 family phage-associated protein
MSCSAKPRLKLLLDGRVVPSDSGLRSASAVRAEFEWKGLSISKWARDHGFNRSLVFEVLAGRKCTRGQSHKVAVLLRLKEGEITA